MSRTERQVINWEGRFREYTLAEYPASVRAYAEDSISFAAAQHLKNEDPLNEFPGFPYSDVRANFSKPVARLADCWERCEGTLAFGTRVETYTLELGEFPSHYKVSKSDEARYLIVPYTMHGDYAGGMVEKSNHEEWEEMFEGQEWWTSHGSYFCTKQIVIDLWALDRDADEETQERVLDVLSGLGDYPLISEERYSELEREEWYSKENFEFVVHDVRSELKKLAPNEPTRSMVENLPGCVFFPMFLEYCSGEEPETSFEGLTPLYPVDKFAEYLADELFDGCERGVTGQMLYEASPDAHDPWCSVSTEERIKYENWAKNLD